MQSIWKKTTFPSFDVLKRDIKTDVLIIGGGIAGILCAYHLKQAGMDPILLESDRLFSGTTGNTTAKLTVQHGLLYAKLLKTHGLETARLYAQANQAALDRYRKLCQKIDCDFEDCSAFVYTRKHPEQLEEELAALTQVGLSARLVPRLPLPFPVAGAVCLEGQAQFHPLKFLSAMVPDLTIYEHTPVLALRTGEALTPYARIQAEHIIVATHFPFLNRHGSYFLKMYQHRSYVLALRGAALPAGMYIDGDFSGLSFRTWGDLLLVGGGSHRTGKQGGCWQELAAFAQKYYPTAQEAGRWAAQDCMTLDGVPYIGRYAKHTPGLYVATGFQKWGMTSAMAAAMLLTDLICGRDNPYAQVFSPSRSMLRPQLARNVLSSVAGLLKPTRPRCPHLGCALTYNRQEHSWDCPCHGSRFTHEGKRLENPANGDLK